MKLVIILLDSKANFMRFKTPLTAAKMKLVAKENAAFDAAGSIDALNTAPKIAGAGSA